MKIRLLAFGFVCAAGLYGQYGHKKFSFQEACFKNPGLPYCQGHEYAIKPNRGNKNGSTASPVLDSDLFPDTVEPAMPSVIVEGGIDWRFADPSATELAGFNAAKLVASPLGRRLIAQLGAAQGLTDADTQKAIAALSNAEQVALSVRDNGMLLMIAGRANDTILPVLDPGWKVATVNGSALVIGTVEAVDQAVQRVAAAGPPAEMTRLGEAWQAGRDFWAMGPGAGASPGLERFWTRMSAQDQFKSDVAFEFSAVPDPSALKMWPAGLGEAVIEGNVIHGRMTVEADELQPKFSQISSSLLGQRLAILVKAARYLPVRDETKPKQSKPTIYGLDSGPREVKQ